MARGDAWRFSGGIYIPNASQWIDSDYSWSANENLPDGWAKTVNGGTCTTNLADGFGGGRCLRIVNASTVNNRLLSGRSPSGSIPQRAKTTGLLVRIRLVFWYKKSGSSQTFSPGIQYWNADESNSEFLDTMTGITAAAASWTKYEATSTVLLNQVDRAFYPDHARFSLLMGGDAGGETFYIDRITVGYQLTDIDGANGYDTVVGYPSPTGLVYAPIALGSYERTHLGQMRRTDSTGGVRPWRLQGHWEIAREADAKLFSLMRALNEGDYCPEDNGSPAPRVSASPLVIEPFLGDGATQASGRMPENFYAWMTEPPNFEWQGYVGNFWGGSIGFEEVG